MRYLQLRLGTKTRHVTTAVVVIALIGVVVLLVGKVSSYGRLTAGLSGAEWPWLALSVLGLVLAFGGYVLGYRDVARVDGGPRLGYPAAAGVVATSLGAFAVSSAGGPAVEYWSLHRAGATRNEAVTRVLALNTLKFLVLGVGAAIAAVVLFAGGGADAPLALTVPWLVAVPVGIALALWLSSRRRALRVPAARPECGLRGFERCLSYLAREGLRDAIHGVSYVRHLLARPHRYPAGVIAFPVYWAGHVLALYAALRAFGATTAIAAVVLAYAAGYLATIVPLPAGGSGGVEAAMTTALHAVGVPLAPALLAVVAYRVVTFWFPLLPVLAVLPTLRRLERQLTAVERDSPSPTALFAPPRLHPARRAA
jgi:uncharacterized protein (TIRG00374 family)